MNQRPTYLTTPVDRPTVIRSTPTTESRRARGVFPDTRILGKKMENPPGSSDWTSICPTCNHCNFFDGLSSNATCSSCGSSFTPSEVTPEEIDSLEANAQFAQRNIKRTGDTHEELLSISLYLHRGGKIEDSDDLLENMILPFFEAKEKIATRGQVFDLLGAQMRVTACNPKRGRVTQQTIIRLFGALDPDKVLETVTLALTCPIGFNKDMIVQQIKDTANRSPLLLMRGQGVDINDLPWCVARCHPEYGLVTDRTTIRIEDKPYQALQKIDIMPIQEDLPRNTCTDLDDLKDNIFTKFVVPFFNGWYRVVESKDSIQIDGVEFKVNATDPDIGYVSLATTFFISPPVRRDEFIRRQEEEDLLMAQRLSGMNPEMDSGMNQGMMHPGLNYGPGGGMQRPGMMRGPMMGGSGGPMIIGGHPAGMRGRQIIIRAPAMGRGGQPQTREEMEEAQHRAQMLLLLLNAMNTSGGRPGEGAQNLSDLFEELERENNRTPEEYLGQLPIQKVNQGFLDRTNEEGEKFNCMICLSEYELDEEIKTLPCLHFFHSECLNEWLTRSRNCPVCKHECIQGGS